MVDLHCHVLPGIDDGPPTMADALALARAAERRGTRLLVATPHVTPAHPGTTAASVAAGVRVLNRALRRAGVDVGVLAGGEVDLVHAAALDDAELAGLRLGGGPWLLVECPHGPLPADAEARIAALRARGHAVLLAHPERSPALQADPDRVDALVRAGALVQLTAAALTGGFGPEAHDTAHALMHRGLVHVVASDAHDAFGRPPVVRPHLEAAGFGGTLADALTIDVPQALLRGRPLPARPTAPPAPRRTSGRRGPRRLKDRIRPADTRAA